MQITNRKYKSRKISQGDYTYRGYRVWACTRFTGLWNISDYKYDSALTQMMVDGTYKWDSEIDTHHTTAYSFGHAKDLINHGMAIKGHLLTWQEFELYKDAELTDSITVDGETRHKAKFGFASSHAENRTFTSNVLFTNQLRYNPQGRCYDSSVEQKWEDTHMIDGIVYWKNNGQVPPMEWLLDFVQIAMIDFATAEKSILQRHQEESESLKHVMVNSHGQVCLHADAFKTYESRSI